MEKLIEEINEIEKNHKKNSLLRRFSKCKKSFKQITEEQKKKGKELRETNDKVKSEMDQILQLIKFYSDHNEVLDKVSGQKLTKISKGNFLYD